MWARAANAAGGAVLLVDELDAMCGVRDPSGEIERQRLPRAGAHRPVAPVPGPPSRRPDRRHCQQYGRRRRLRTKALFRSRVRGRALAGSRTTCVGSDRTDGAALRLEADQCRRRRHSVGRRAMPNARERRRHSACHLDRPGSRPAPRREIPRGTKHRTKPTRALSRRKGPDRFSLDASRSGNYSRAIWERRRPRPAMNARPKGVWHGHVRRACSFRRSRGRS